MALYKGMEGVPSSVLFKHVGPFFLFFGYIVLICVYIASLFCLSFGMQICTLWSLKKGGLPHTHTLVWLKADTKDPSPSFIDGLISAELPGPLVDPLGYALADKFMVHGPCGAYNAKCACMKNNSCSKRFPKPLSDDTMIDHVGYPVYRRRDTGLYVLRQKDTLRLGNQWVVPYNLNLLKRFDAHINVEWCNKTKLLKYLFKYLTKGHDVVRMRFHAEDMPPGVFTVPCPTGRNEIDDYIKCRFVDVLR